MRIGIDIRPLQMHHKYRGIGMHMLKLIPYLDKLKDQDDILVLYEYEGLESPIHELGLREGYEVVKIPATPSPTLRVRLPHIIPEALHNINRVRSPIPDAATDRCDVFLYFDFMLGLPAPEKKSVLVLYDLIPLVYKKDYFPILPIAMARNGWRHGIRDTVVKYLYRWAAKTAILRSTKVLSISDSSKEQAVKCLKVPGDKIVTVYLGAPDPISSHEKISEKVRDLVGSDYLLYIGGGDARRRIDHLVGAFEALRKKYPSLKLVMAGKDFTDVSSVPIKQNRRAIESCENGMVMLGFINDTEKKLLYQKSKAFVYPTLSEGFGLPILEAMDYETPVISYSSPMSSVEEVAGSAGLVGEPNQDFIYKSVQKILDDSVFTEELKKKGKQRVDNFSWETNARETLSLLRSSI